MSDTTRIDKWLWAVRIFKTRSDASSACGGGHVRVDDRTVKPSHKVKVGDRVKARRGERDFDLEVVRIIDKRVGASVAVSCFIDHSPPPPERVAKPAFAERDRGTGRPTKKDRRQMERMFGRRGRPR